MRYSLIYPHLIHSPSALPARYATLRSQLLQCTLIRSQYGTVLCKVGIGWMPDVSVQFIHERFCSPLHHNSIQTSTCFAREARPVTRPPSIGRYLLAGSNRSYLTSSWSEREIASERSRNLKDPGSHVPRAFRSEDRQTLEVVTAESGHGRREHLHSVSWRSCVPL
jgi:hypothetical protein